MGPVFTPLGGGGARDVSAREAQGDAQAVGVVFSGGAAAVTVHGFGDQCQAEAAVFFAVQGVVALKEARQGVVGDGGCGAVVQAEGGVAAALCNGEGEGAAFRGGADGVFQQVSEGLFEPEGIGAKGKRWFGGSVGGYGLVVFAHCRGLFQPLPSSSRKGAFPAVSALCIGASTASFLLPPPQFFPPGARVGSGHEEGAFSSVMFSWRLRRFCASRACWACTSLCRRVAISSGCLLSGSFSRRESSSRRLLCWAIFAAKCNVLCGKEKAASGAEAAV